MRSLRARLAILLMVAIIGVVIAAAFVTFQIAGPSHDGSFQRSFAEEVRVISTVLGGSVDKARALDIRVGGRPPETAILDYQSSRINAALREVGSDVSVAVLGDPDGTARSLSFPISGDRWAYIAYPSTPPSKLQGLAAYLALVILGTLAVSLYAASKITRPMKMLESAIGLVGRDGTLPHIEETGPAEVRATAHALNELSSRLKTAIESRMRLVAAAGHDLRTPMTRMRLRAEFLPDEDRETWLKDLEELDRIADSAIRLVREEVGDLSPMPVRLDSMVSEIVAELREIGRKVTVAGNEPIAIMGRPLALKRAIRNLVENAATHGGGGTIRASKVDGRAVLEIEDSGPGIPEDLMDQVFEPFFRVDPARRQFHSGAGLGFAIAKEIIDQAEGTIEIANRPEGGLRQEVRFPLGAQAA